MRLIQCFEENLRNMILSQITAQEEALIYIIPKNTCAFVGYNNAVDDALLTKHGVYKIDIGNEGGVIVSEKNSFAFAHLSNDLTNHFNQLFATLFIEYLQHRGLNVGLYGNDILIDGIYKVASYSSRRYGNLLFSAFHISYDVNLDLIQAICTKQMQKIPKGLKEYGITAEEISEFFFNNYQLAL